jgi:hypothetical protein
MCFCFEYKAIENHLHSQFHRLSLLLNFDSLAAFGFLLGIKTVGSRLFGFFITKFVVLIAPCPHVLAAKYIHVLLVHYILAIFNFKLFVLGIV